MTTGLVGSEMCIRDSSQAPSNRSSLHDIHDGAQHDTRLLPGARPRRDADARTTSTGGQNKQVGCLQTCQGPQPASLLIARWMTDGQCCLWTLTLKGIQTHKSLKRTLFITRVQELCESRGGRPGLSVLTSLTVSVDVKQHWTVLRHWSHFVPNMSTRHPRT